MSKLVLYNSTTEWRIKFKEKKIFVQIMNKFFFLSALFVSSTFSSPAAISFIDEQAKIMNEFNKLNALKRDFSGHCSNKDFKDHFKPLFELDPVIFLKGMNETTDKIFLFTFWNTFDSIYLFLCNNQYRKKTQKSFKNFLAQVHLTSIGKACATDMLCNFKIYLIKAMATCQGDRLKEMLFEAEDFYTLRLKGLILEVLGKQNSKTLFEQIEKMYQNFRFYHQCTEKDNLKHMLTREYRMLKTAMKSNNQKWIGIHAENMTFIAGILKQDRSTIYGLHLIADQSPEFVGFFLIMQNFQTSFLKRPFLNIEDEPKIYRNTLLSYLKEKIPVFESTCNQKFTPLKEFTNGFEGILGKEDLTDLARTLFRKLISIQ
jgi:hypothetical protein